MVSWAFAACCRAFPRCPPGAANAAPPRHPAATLAQPQQTAAADSDHTLAAMQDELDRSRTRLELKIPGTNQPARPYLHPVPRSRSGRAHDCRGIWRAGFLDPRAQPHHERGCSRRETTISTARTSLPMKVSAVSSARPARSGSTAITIPCARISGSPPIRRSRPPSRIFPRSRRSCRAWRRRPAFLIFPRRRPPLWSIH